MSEAASRRGLAGAWSWLTYAPLERIPWSVSPIVWSAAEIFHALHLTWSAPALFTFAASCIAFGKASKKAARSENPELDGLEASLTWAVPGAWLTAATHWGPFAGHLIGPAPVSAMDLLAVGSSASGPSGSAVTPPPGMRPSAARWPRPSWPPAGAPPRAGPPQAPMAPAGPARRAEGLAPGRLRDHDNGSETWEINTKGAPASWPATSTSVTPRR